MKRFTKSYVSPNKAVDPIAQFYFIVYVGFSLFSELKSSMFMFSLKADSDFKKLLVPEQTRRRGMDHRQTYTAAFKAQVIADVLQGAAHQTLAKLHNISASLVIVIILLKTDF